MIILTHIYRAPSSGNEQRTVKSFTTLKEAAEYIHEVWYDFYCESNGYPCDWEEENMGPFPKKSEFTLEAIQSKLKNKKKLMIFGPFNKWHQLTPDELWIDITSS